MRSAKDEVKYKSFSANKYLEQKGTTNRQLHLYNLLHVSAFMKRHHQTINKSEKV